MLKILGLDIGTTTISAVAINAINGDVLSAGNRLNDSAMNTSNGRKIQNPKRILEIVLDLKKEMQEKHGTFVAIGVTGQMHGMLYLNRELEAVSPLYTWQDERGNLPYQNTTYAKYLSEVTGYALASGYGIVTDFVNRAKGDRPENATLFCTIHDWVAAKLCNSTKIVMHTSNAASYGCFDIAEGCFDQEALKKIELDISSLPEVTDDFIALGTDSDGAVVSVAIGDNQASVVGSLSGEGCALANIGTGSQISVPTAKYCNVNGIDVRPFYKKECLLVGAPLCGGRSYAMLKNFYALCLRAFELDVEDIYYYMNRMAGEEPGEKTLYVDTRFCGTRDNSTIRGAITNIGIDNFTPQELTRGFLYGMAKELYDLYNQMRPAISENITCLVGSGNAIRKSTVLQSYLSEIFGLPIKIPRHKEEAAFGAAVSATVAINYYKDIMTAQTTMIHYL